jgi:hypothetical protein
MAGNKKLVTVAVDRTGWDPGPWDTEEDRYEWWTPQGYPALILRTDFGNLCGYVAIPRKHPCHGVDYNQEPVDSLLVHGGVTYSRPPQGVIARDDGDADWWIGFDCAHAFDLAPGLLSDLKRRLPAFAQMPPFDVYRDVEYVRGECETLASQLHSLTRGLRLLS